MQRMYETLFNFLTVIFILIFITLYVFNVAPVPEIVRIGGFLILAFAIALPVGAFLAAIFTVGIAFFLALVDLFWIKEED